MVKKRKNSIILQLYINSAHIHILPVIDTVTLHAHAIRIQLAKHNPSTAKSTAYVTTTRVFGTELQIWN